MSPVIPQYPDFMKLGKECRKDIEVFVAAHPPYSDFNFVSLWNWNTDGSTQVSMLNNNLVVRLKDYTDDKCVYSLLGENMIRESIETLLRTVDLQGSEIKLIPESIVNHAHPIPMIEAIEDRDQHDYIYSISELISLSGSQYKKKRNLYKGFVAKYRPSLLTCGIKSGDTKNRVLDLLHDWESNTIKSKVNAGEIIAIERLFELDDSSRIFVFFLLIGEKVEGFAIAELLHSDHCMIHFQKSNHRFAGSTEYLLVESLKILQPLGMKFLNYQQDLGQEGLRIMKELWRPHHYLKKYKISKKINP